MHTTDTCCIPVVALEREKDLSVDLPDGDSGAYCRTPRIGTIDLPSARLNLGFRTSWRGGILIEDTSRAYGGIAEVWFHRSCGEGIY